MDEATRDDGGARGRWLVLGIIGVALILGLIGLRWRKLTPRPAPTTTAPAADARR